MALNNIKVELGDAIEEWNRDDLVGKYLVSAIPINNDIFYALVSLNGIGIGNGYFDSIEYLEEVLSIGEGWKNVGKIK